MPEQTEERILLPTSELENEANCIEEIGARAEELPIDNCIPSSRLAATSSAVRNYLAEQRLSAANQLVFNALDARIAADNDDELQAARSLLQHYATLVGRMEPLAHLGCTPLRPDDRLHQCFSHFIDLLHQQNGQIRELLAIVAELS